MCICECEHTLYNDSVFVGIFAAAFLCVFVFVAYSSFAYFVLASNKNTIYTNCLHARACIILTLTHTHETNTHVCVCVVVSSLHTLDMDDYSLLLFRSIFIFLSSRSFIYLLIFRLCYPEYVGIEFVWLERKRITCTRFYPNKVHICSHFWKKKKKSPRKFRAISLNRVEILRETQICGFILKTFFFQCCVGKICFFDVNKITPSFIEANTRLNGERENTDLRALHVWMAKHTHTHIPL